MISKNGEEKSKYQIAAVKVYVDEIVPQIKNWGSQILAYLEEGDSLADQINALEKLAGYQVLDSVRLKRSVADRIIELESYPF